MVFNLKTKEQCFIDFDFFFLKEYEIEAGKNLSTEQLVETFINAREFINTFHPSVGMDTIKELPIQDIKSVVAYTMHGPFVIECIGVNDFKRYKGSELENILLDYRDKAGLNEADSVVNNFQQSLQIIQQFQIEEDDLFHLNKEWFSPPHKALA